MYLTVVQLNQLNKGELSKKMSNENQKAGFVTLVVIRHLDFSNRNSGKKVISDSFSSTM